MAALFSVNICTFLCWAPFSFPSAALHPSSFSSLTSTGDFHFPFPVIFFNPFFLFSSPYLSSSFSPTGHPSPPSHQPPTERHPSSEDPPRLHLLRIIHPAQLNKTKYGPPKTPTLCIGARMGHEVEVLRKVGVSDSIGIDLVPSPPLVVRGDFHCQPFAADTFDFEFSSVFDHALYPRQLHWDIVLTLKPGGFCVLHAIVLRHLLEDGPLAAEGGENRGGGLWLQHWYGHYSLR